MHSQGWGVSAGAYSSFQLHLRLWLFLHHPPLARHSPSAFRRSCEGDLPLQCLAMPAEEEFLSSQKSKRWDSYSSFTLLMKKDPHPAATEVTHKIRLGRKEAMWYDI